MLHCTELREVDLMDIPWLTDQSLSAIFASLTHLTDVELHNIPLITDRSILVLVRHCPKVQQLWLSCLPGVTDRSISTFAALEWLEVLRINTCASLTDHTVWSLACHCKKLTTVSLSDSPLVTEVGIIDLLVYGKRLTALTVIQCGVKRTIELDEHLQRRASSRRVMEDLYGIGHYIL